MKAVVTGSLGFVGPHLIAHLVASGDEVVGADRSTGTDICDPSSIGAILDQERPDVVYHLAGWSDVGASWDDPASTFEVNATGTLHTLDAARAAGVDRVLVVSSADVYGKVTTEDLPISESQPLRPISPYGASKVAAEYLALQAWTGYGLCTIRVRSFNHIGPGQDARFVASALAHRVAEAERSGVDHISVGNVTPRRDFTDVRDVVRAYRLAVLHGEPGEVYNVASGRDVAIEDLARSLIERAEAPLRLDIDPSLQRLVDNPVSVGDATRLRNATGWAPEIPLDETLAALLADARQTDPSRPTPGHSDSTRT